MFNLMAVSTLFVYGTLRSDSPKKSPVKSSLNRYAKRAGKAAMQGRLYEIDWYPGVVQSEKAEDIVTGELYILTNEAKLLQHLDEYEGCSAHFPEPHEYMRRKIPVQTESGETVQAWVYLYNWELPEESRILTGDYLGS